MDSWIILVGVLLGTGAALFALSSKCNKHTVVITEIGYLIFFAASLVPPFTTDTNDLYEAFAIVICFILLLGIFNVVEHHEWIFDIISAFVFGVSVQLALTSAPFEQVIQVFGLAVVTAGIARGVGQHVDLVGRQQSRT
jgi:hypothetical protein